LRSRFVEHHSPILQPEKMQPSKQRKEQQDQADDLETESAFPRRARESDISLTDHGVSGRLTGSGTD
jgi:hypothetical protein